MRSKIRCDEKFCKVLKFWRPQSCPPRDPWPGPTRKPYNQVADWPDRHHTTVWSCLSHGHTGLCLAGDKVTRPALAHLVAWLHCFLVIPKPRSTRGQLPIGWYSCCFLTGPVCHFVCNYNAHPKQNPAVCMAVWETTTIVDFLICTCGTPIKLASMSTRYYTRC